MSFVRTGLCLAAALLARPAVAQTNWVGGTSGNWTDPTRWSAGVPMATTDALIAAAGSYSIALTGSQATNSLTLNAAGATVNGVGGGTFTLGGAMTLAAGDWRMGGAPGSPQVFSGGTITRGSGGTGTLTVAGDVRLNGTQVDGAVLRFPQTADRLRMSSGANLISGRTVTFPVGFGSSPFAGIAYESSATLAGVTVNLATSATLGAVGGTTLTLGPSTVVQSATPTDPEWLGTSYVGREYTEGNFTTTAVVNQGTVRAATGDVLVGGRAGGIGNPALTTLSNTGLLEATTASMTIITDQFVNQPGGVVRVVNGGSMFVLGLDSMANRGSFEVGGGNSRLFLGGRFTTTDIGTLTRTGSNTVSLYIAEVNNSNNTWVLSAATGRIRLLGDFVGGSRITGGAVTATDGTKLEVRSAESDNPTDYSHLKNVQIGSGVLEFFRNGRVLLEGTTTLAAGETITLPGDSTLAFAQTRTLDDMTVAFSGINGQTGTLAVVDSNAIVLGPTTVIRKTGTAGAATLAGQELAAGPHVASLENRGLIRVEGGTLYVEAFGAAATPLSNRGVVQVDAGAVLYGSFPTASGGRLQGSGAVFGSPRIGPGGTLSGGTTTGQLGVTLSVTLMSSPAAPATLATAAARTGTNAATSGRVATNTTLDLAGLGGGGALRLDLDGPTLVQGEAYTLTLATAAGGVRRNGTATGASFTFSPSEYVLVSDDFPGFSGVSLRTTDANTLVLSFTPVPEPLAGLGLAAVALLVGRRVRR